MDDKRILPDMEAVFRFSVGMVKVYSSATMLDLTISLSVVLHIEPATVPLIKTIVGYIF